MHLSGACLEQAIRRGFQRLARRQHIVDEPDPGPGPKRQVDAKGTAHVRPSRGAVQTGLGGRRAGACQPGGMAGKSACAGHGAGDPLGLVEAPGSSTARMERDRQDSVRRAHALAPQSVRQHPTQESNRVREGRRRAEGASGGPFEAGQPDAQGAFVSQQRMTGMERRSVGETARTAVAAGFEQTRLGFGTEGHAAATARTAIREPPPGKSSQARAAERRRSGVGVVSAADARGGCDQIEQGGEEVQGSGPRPRRLARADARRRFGTACMSVAGRPDSRGGDPVPTAGPLWQC